MPSTKSIFSSDSTTGASEEAQVDRQIALEYLAEAWNSAEEDGLESAALAHASLFAALATFVRMHGDDATAEMIRQLPDRIRAGEYNLDRVLQ
jgi:LPS O-antigen subunit length determinant protein (WzzB/FepE family)